MDYASLLKNALSRVADSLANGTFRRKDVLAEMLRAFTEDLEKCDATARSAARLNDVPSDLETVLNQRLEDLRRQQRDWAEKTDCDRLDAAFERLSQLGLVAIQHAGGSMSMGLDDVRDEQKYRTHRARPARGYCFYHSQDIDRAVTTGELPLAFGSFDDDPARGIAVGDEVVNAIQLVGLRVRWQRTAADRVLVEMRWQRRVDRPLPVWVPEGRPYPFLAPGEEEALELRRAAFWGEVDTVQRLLHQGVDPNAASEESGETALHKASFRGSAEVVALLLQAAANPNARGPWGETPLHVAVQRCHVRVIEALLSEGADRTIQNVLKKTPVDDAKEKGDPAVLRLLGVA